MCNSIAEGGGRCAAHIEAEIKNHRHNYNWEVIKAANEDGVQLPDVELLEEEEKLVRQKLRSNEEYKDSLKKASDAVSVRNREFSKYSFVLSTKDPGQVARYLYESSDEVVQGKIDAAKAQKAYDTRLLEIDYNAKAQEESGIERQEARTPDAASKLQEATKVYTEASRTALRAEDAMMSSMREAEAKAATGGTEVAYDNNLANLNKQAQEDYAKASTELKWAQRAVAEAEDYDRRNFHAVFNPEAEREKAKLQHREIMETVRMKSSRARSKATHMASYAITAYRNGDKSSMNIPQGPEKGKLPDGLRRADEAFKAADSSHKKLEDLLQKKARRELTREKLAETPEFKAYAQDGFIKSKRGVEYAGKKQHLTNEYKMTEKYKKSLVSKVDVAKVSG